MFLRRSYKLRNEKMIMRTSSVRISNGHPDDVAELESIIVKLTGKIDWKMQNPLMKTMWSDI